MATILDYLDQYKDIGFDAEPFNEVDNLLIAQLSYLELSGIAPEGYSGSAITVKDAAHIFFSTKEKAEIYDTPGLASPLTPFILQKMSQGKRFSGARISNYVHRLDADLCKQFAALCFTLDDGTAYIAYRGTDSTLIGWRENFMMGYSTVPAQKEALTYLERVARSTGNALRIGGHSKGGNLAVYASVLCQQEVQGRIVAVYNNDGPGFSKDAFPPSSIQRVQDKIHTFVPEYCIVGMLFDTPTAPVVVSSEEKGVMQHSAPTWEVEKNRFSYRENLSPDCEPFNRIFNEWIYSIDQLQREPVVSAFFDALEAAEIVSIDDLALTSPKQIARIAQSLDGIEGSNKAIIEDLIASLIGQTVHKKASPILRAIEKGFRVEKEDGSSRCADEEISINNMKAYRKRKKNRSRWLLLNNLRKKLTGNTLVRGALLGFIGLLLMANAEVAAPVICYIGLAGTLGASFFLLFKFFRGLANDRNTEPAFFLGGLFLGVVSILLLVFQSALIVSFNLVLGIAFSAYGLYKLKQSIRKKAEGSPRWWFFAAISAACIILGVTLLINPTHLAVANQFIAGLAITGKGIYDVIVLIYLRSKKESRTKRLSSYMKTKNRSSEQSSSRENERAA